MTASIGVAELDRANPTPRALVETADRALYDAKRDGRNRVVTRAMAAASSSTSG